jgi:hypothetical protein
MDLSPSLTSRKRLLPSRPAARSLHSKSALRRAGKGSVAAPAKLKANADRRAHDLPDTVATIRADGATSLQAE